MEIDEALELWSSGKLTVKEVFVATGLRTMSAVYDEITYDLLDRENEKEFDMKREVEAMDQAEMEALAWTRWSDWLREEPRYLETCVRMLKHERQLQLKKIGRRIADVTANWTIN